jgi:hypothetical protein
VAGCRGCSGSLAELSASELAAERLLALCADLARLLVPRESARLAVDLDFGRELEPLLFVGVAVLLRDPGRVRSERSVTVDVDVDVVREAVAFDLTASRSQSWASRTPETGRSSISSRT